MTERNENCAVAEQLLDVSCRANGLTLSAANRETVVMNVLALIDAAKKVQAAPLPEDIEPATLFRVTP